MWDDRPCANGHVWLWSSDGSSDTFPPEGMPCMCGGVRARIVKCPTCGQYRNEPEMISYGDLLDAGVEQHAAVYRALAGEEDDDA